MILLNVSMINSYKIFCHKNIRATYLSVERLKGYMVSERLGTPVLKNNNWKHIIKKWNMLVQ